MSSSRSSKNQAQSPMGMPFPIPNVQGQGPTAFPFPMPDTPTVPQPAAQMQAFTEQFTTEFAEQLAQQLIQQTLPYIPFASQVSNEAGEQDSEAQPAIPPMFVPFALPSYDADKQTVQSQQSAQAPFPIPPFAQFQNGMPQPQAMLAFPFAIPFPMQKSTDEQSSDE